MKRLLFVILALCSVGALAGEAEIRQVMRAKFPNLRVDGVQPAPVPGLYEVRFTTPEGPQILYSDAQGAYLLIDANIVESKSGRNLTEERLQKLSAIDFNTLPLDMAVKIQRGNGRRVLAMFSDPYCPYCRRFEQSLQQLDDVTIYVFMFPVIRPENADHSRAVWCAPDRAKAWLELAASDRPKVPPTGSACDNPVDKVLELGRSLRINGTPTLFFANGERTSGGLPLDRLRAKLDEVAKQVARKP